MSSAPDNPHRAKRWKYQNDLVIAQKDGTRSSGKIFSISKSGILFRSEMDADLQEVVNIGWKDQDAGVIKGSFNIRTKVKSKETTGFDYRARYYKVDVESKKNLLSLLKNLQSLKSSSGSLGIDGIKNVIAANTKIFSDYQAGETQNNPSLHVLIKEIPEIALQKCLRPLTTFDHGLRKMQACHIQLSTVYAFLTNTKSYTYEELSYCLSITKNLLEDYLKLENEDHTAIKTPDPVDEEEGEILSEEDLAKQQQEEAEQEKLIYIFKSLSNSTFGLAKNLVIDLKDQVLLQKVSDRSDEVLQTLNNQAKAVVDYFYKEIDVSSEYISDMDMILTRSAYEVEHTAQKSLEEEDAPKKTTGQKEAIRAFIAQVALVFLCFVFFFLLWKESTKYNVSSQYKNEFSFNALKVTKVQKRGNILSVFVKSTSGLSLKRDSAEVQSAVPVIRKFMDENTKIAAIMLYDHRSNQIVTSAVRFEK